MTIYITLEDFLANPETCTSLNLQGENITDAECIQIANAIPRANQLTEIHLERNNIEDNGATVLAEALATNDTITLNLDFNRLSVNVAQRINNDQISTRYQAIITQNIPNETDDTHLYDDLPWTPTPPLQEDLPWTPRTPTLGEDSDTEMSE